MRLSDIEMFRGLSAREQSRLFGNMEKIEFPAGTPIFHQGEAGDAMYVIDDGSIELLTVDDEGVRNTLAVLKPGDAFGEMSILTDTDRTASAIARLDSTLYRLRAETFNELLENNAISNYFLRLLCLRLKQTDITLHLAESSRKKVILSDLAKMGEDLRKVLLCGSVLPTLDAKFLGRYLELDAAARLEECSRLFPYVLKEDKERGTVAIHSSLHRQLRELYHAGFDAEHKACLLAAAARHYLEAGRVTRAVQVYVDNQCWPEACRTATGVAEKLEENPELLAAVLKQLAHCPEVVLFQHYQLLLIVLKAQLATDAAAGLLRLESALTVSEEFFSREQEIPLYELASDYCQRLGLEHKSLEYIHMALTIAGEVGKSDGVKRPEEAGGPSRSYRLSRQEMKGAIGASLALSKTRSLFHRSLSLSVCSAALALALIVVFGLLPPVAGLSDRAMLCIGISLAAVVMWVADTIPSYVVALLMLLLWVLLKIVKPDTALAGFASPTWMYLLGTLALGTAIAKSGLLYRLSLYMLKAFPKTHLGQLVGFAASGLVLNPLIPSPTTKVSLAAPIAQSVAESMGFANRSNGAAALGLMSMMFYGFMTPFFLTGSSFNVVVMGLVPGKPYVSPTHWFLYALPTLIFFSIGVFLLVVTVYRPEKVKKRLSDAVLDEQLKILGKVSREELVTVVITLALGLGMLLQPLHGVDNAWLLLGGMCFLVIGGVLDVDTLKGGIDWTYLLFTGAFFGFAGVLDQVGIVNPLTRVLGVVMKPFMVSPYVFLLTVLVFTFLLATTVREDATAIVLSSSMCPLAKGIGIHPWVVVLVILMATDPFFYSGQSTTYLTAYYSAEEKSFTLDQGPRLSRWVAIIAAVAVALSIPFWQMMGLIR